MSVCRCMYFCVSDEYLILLPIFLFFLSLSPSLSLPLSLHLSLMLFIYIPSLCHSCPPVLGVSAGRGSGCGGECDPCVCRPRCPCSHGEVASWRWASCLCQARCPWQRPTAGTQSNSCT